MENHYAASVGRAEQVLARYNEVSALASRYDLLTLTPNQAADFALALSAAAPARYYSDQIAAVMGYRLMPRPEIIKALESAGIEVNRKRLATALVNRKNFELVAEPGHHRTGKYRVRRDARKLAPRTRNDYLIACGMFYKWAMARGWLKKNPFEGIKRAREEHYAEIVWLTRDERDAITRSAESSPGRLAIWIALYAGLREGEIARLRWEDVDLRWLWIHVENPKRANPAACRFRNPCCPRWTTPRKRPAISAPTGKTVPTTQKQTVTSCRSRSRCPMLPANCAGT